MRKGEHATPIIFWKWLAREVEKDDGTLTEKHFPFLRYYNVFNAEQTEGCRLPSGTVVEGEGNAFNPLAACEAAYANMANHPQLYHGATESILRGPRLEAYYSPSADRVVMPRREAFDSPEFYYSVLFHEFIHKQGK